MSAVPAPVVVAITDPQRLTDPEYLAAYLDHLIDEAATAAAARYPADDLTADACRTAFQQSYQESGMRGLAEILRENIGAAPR